MDYMIETIFSLGLFINAALFIPQILKILKERHTEEISLITFGGFWIIQLFTVLHGILAKDFLLVLGFGLSLLTCGTVVCLIIFFRFFKK
jgi:MtN3 and saliva related transmembrane protein